MKYAIIVCLLFVLINSKKEIKHKFSLLKDLKGNDYDSNASCDADTKDKCKNLPIPEEDEICCYYVSKRDGKITEEGCYDFPSEILEIGDVYLMKEYQAMNRESTGYYSYSHGEEIRYKKLKKK